MTPLILGGIYSVGAELPMVCMNISEARFAQADSVRKYLDRKSASHAGLMARVPMTSVDKESIAPRIGWMKLPEKPAPRAEQPQAKTKRVKADPLICETCQGGAFGHPWDLPAKAGERACRVCGTGLPAKHSPYCTDEHYQLHSRLQAAAATKGHRLAEKGKNAVENKGLTRLKKASGHRTIQKF